MSVFVGEVEKSFFDEEKNRTEIVIKGVYMSSDNIAALEEIRRNGMAFAASIESLFRSNSVNAEALAEAYRMVLSAVVIAEKAIENE